MLNVCSPQTIAAVESFGEQQTAHMFGLSLEDFPGVAYYEYFFGAHWMGIPFLSLAFC